MARNELVVGNVRARDGEPITARGGNQGETITSDMSGQYFEQLLRGNMFVYVCPAQALVLAATGGGHPTIINPVGSGVLFVPVALELGFVSGTTTIGSVLLAETLSVGGGAATGAAVLTATLVAGKNALRGCGKASQVQWSPTTNTFTAAPTVLSATGYNLAAAAPTGPMGVGTPGFQGRLGFAPGTAMSIVYSVTTSTALFHMTLYGLELPLPLTI